MSTPPGKAAYDPRIGDEAAEEEPAESPPRPRLKIETQSEESEQDEKQKKKDDDHERAPHKPLLSRLPVNLTWIPANFTWSKLKPAIRSALSAWICLLLMIIMPSLRTMGQAGFLTLIASVLVPPSGPFVANAEQSLTVLLFVSLAWAWGCLGIKLATFSRSQIITNAHPNDIFAGHYVEAGPSAIIAVFIFIGSAFFLFIKARQGPGPFLFASVLGCIGLDISLTTAVLFPYANYRVGRAVVLPIAFQTAVSIALSVLVFPQTISYRYTMQLRAILGHLNNCLEQHRAVLKIPTSSPDFSPAAITAAANAAEAGLAGLGMSGRLLKRDFSYSRFSPADLSEFRPSIQRLVVRANGLGMYFTLIDPTRERFPVTPAPGTPAPGTPIHSPTPSRPASRVVSRSPSPERSAAPSMDAGPSPHVDFPHPESPRRARKRHPHFDLGRSPPSSRPMTPASSRRHSRERRTHAHMHSQLLHGLTQIAHVHVPGERHHREHVVGVFESQRYLDLESTHFGHPLAALFTERATALLRESCAELTEACQAALKDWDMWLDHSRAERFTFWKSQQGKVQRNREVAKKLEKTADELKRALDHFRKEKRHMVVDPYRSAFNSKHEGLMTGEGVPPHRFMFHCYVYQYHLTLFAMALIESFDNIIRMEQKRHRARVWLPAMPFYNVLKWTVWEHSVDWEQEDDENPDVIQGMDETWMDMGEAQRRDPDALPPRNAFERVMNFLWHVMQAFSGGNLLFAVKGGILTILLTLPSLIRGSAGFAYAQRFSWAIFMGQLTIARFRGDTTFGLVARITSTFFGGLLGTVVWYISTGTGRGNAFGLATTLGVAFPFFFFMRLYWTVPPMINIIFFVTCMLVVGFSWQNTHFVAGPFTAFGINLAWRRFVLVAAGVTAAFLFSFLPPSTTLRRYQRSTLSTTSTELGSVYCSVVSFANVRHGVDTQEILNSLIAVRLKLKRSIMLRTNIIYEFSLRGRWPAKRYQKIVEIQLQLGYLLSHLTSVVERLEPAWSRAFLRRTRFLDSDFQGDVLAVISLVSISLRTGHPLPQITPCPLFDRFTVHHHGLNVVRQEADDDYGLPRTMTVDTLEDEQYMCFCVGVATAFGIVTRLDRLMVATKELVGEQYHIHGVGYVSRVGGVEMGTRTSSLRPGMDA